MKVILSRKGFDSGAGGYASPYFVEEGRLLSFPIPEENKIYTIDTGWRYSDLRYDHKTSYLDIMKQLGINGFENKSAHLDPDINQDIVNNRVHGWKGLFGQCDAAQQHLLNNNVEPGDIFLFFGWFKEVKFVKGRYKYIGGTDKHIIWGYMQIGTIEKIEELREYEEWKLYHPHFRNRDRKSNTAYIARENLDFNLDKPGFGVLKYSDSLVLTCTGQKNRTVWSLPNFFHPDCGTKVTYHENPKLWELGEDRCILTSVCRGQEFVIKDSCDAVKWAKDIIVSNI